MTHDLKTGIFVVKICGKHSTVRDVTVVNKYTHKKCKKLISWNLDLLCPASTPDGKNQDIPMLDRWRRRTSHCSEYGL